jgi:predicted PurR-regulated permease PerM
VRLSLSTARHIFGKHGRLIAFVLIVGIIFGILYALRSAIFPFVVGLGIAYLLMPFIKWVEKKLPFQDRWQGTKRVTIILLIYLVTLGLIALLSFYMITAVVNAFLVIINNAPQYVSRGLYQLEQFAEFMRQQFPPEIQNQINEFLVEGGTTLGEAVRNTFVTGVSFIPTTFTMVFGFAALPIFLFYMLKDSEKLSDGFYSAFSPWVARHVKNIIAIIEGVLGRYIRAQLLLGFIVGYLVFIGLLILRIEFAPVLAVFAGITELIPTVGPWIGGGAAVIVTLALVPEKAIWVALLFFLVQMLENNLLVPRIQGGYLRVHPAAALFLLVIGTYIAGFWGLLMAVPLAATIVAIYKYVHNEMQIEDSLPPPQA